MKEQSEIINKKWINDYEYFLSNKKVNYNLENINEIMSSSITCIENLVNCIVGMKDYNKLYLELIKLINMYKKTALNIEIFKNKDHFYRPCVIFHKSDKEYWVMQIHTLDDKNFKEKFDVMLNNERYIKCCGIKKVHISFIKNRISINNINKIDDINLKNKIIDKFTWFFLNKNEE